MFPKISSQLKLYIFTLLLFAYSAVVNKTIFLLDEQINFQTGVELSRGQPIRISEEDDEEEAAAPEKSGNKRVSLDDRTQQFTETEASPVYPSANPTDNPTTEYPSVMDKVALDLYAFLQQGQSNLIDASSSEPGETGDSTTLSDDEITTDLTTTAEFADSTIANESNTTSTTTTTTTTEPTTTTTMEPSTTTTQAPAGRGKFRRPAIGGPAISRNRYIFIRINFS